MAQVTVNFPTIINASLQVGDTVYFVNTTTASTFEINASNVVEFGVVAQLIGITGSYSGIVVSTSIPAASYPTLTDYFFFTKDNKANQSSVLGYYSQVNIRNNSKDEAELFSVGVDFFQSSK